MARRKRKYGKYFSEMLKAEGTHEEQMLASFEDPDLLDEQHKAILTRLRAAWSMMLNNRLQSEIVPILAQDFGISERQAWRDIARAQKLFGNIIKADKEAVRVLHYNLAQKVFNLAHGKGDFKTMLNAVQVMNELMGVNVDEGGLQDSESLSPSKFVIQINNNQQTLNINLDKLQQLSDNEKKQLSEAATQDLDPEVSEIEAMLDEKK